MSNVVGIIGGSMMIDAKRLLEIERRRGQAQFGYGVMGNREYASDVGELLGEVNSLDVQVRHLEGTAGGLRKELEGFLDLVGQMKDEVSRLRKDNEELSRQVVDLQSRITRVCEDDFDTPDSVKQAIAASGDPRYYLEGKPRCQKEPGGEQCGLVEGHEGGCKWLGGD